MKKYPVPQVHVRFVNVNLGGGALAKECSGSIFYTWNYTETDSWCKQYPG